MAFAATLESSLNDNDIMDKITEILINDNYISRAINVHQRSKKGYNFDFSSVIEIIHRLQNKDNKRVSKLIPFQPYITPIEALQLNINFSL